MCIWKSRLIIKAVVTAADALAPGLFWLQDVRKTLSKPHFIFLEWNQMWGFFIVFSFGQPLRTRNNFAFPLHSSRWYFVYATSADVSSVPASASCNCWVIDCKTGIISELVFDLIKRRRCRWTGVRLSPSVSWCFLLHHNIQPPQPPPPKISKWTSLQKSEHEWALMLAGNSLLTEREKLRQRQATLDLSGLFLSLALCQLIMSPLLHHQQNKVHNSWTYEWFCTSKCSETNPIPFHSPWRCNNAELELTKAANL